MVNRVPLLAGNWKMNKGPLEAENFVKDLASTIHDNESLSKAVKARIVEIGVFPPFVSLERAKKGIFISGIPMSLGAQNMHWEDNGAFTGEVSGEMLKEVGCKYVILGHSERRHIFREINEMIGKKMKKALSIGLKPILCVGETLEERDGGITESVVEEQLEEAFRGLTGPLNQEGNVIIAYEPVWAIGTGRKASDEDAQRMCLFIRKFIGDKFGSTAAQNVRILYGGSVKPDNTKGLMSQTDVDGALIGGASLDVESFLGIVKNTIDVLL